MILLLLKNKIKTLLEKTEAPDFETKEILKWAVGEEASFLPADTEIDGEKAEKALSAAKRRIKGEPLQYILGEWDFYGLTFKVGAGVLIPRPETEILVERALENLPENGVVIDLCSGSGCIPISISKSSGAYCCGVEISEPALQFFRENIRLHKAEDRVKAVKGDVLEPSREVLSLLPRKCDIITANPPYLTAEEMASLQSEVRCEPEIALFGGRDGLDYYRRIFRLWKDRLSEGGMFLAEVGDGQSEAVRLLMEKEGCRCEICRDYNKIPRVVMGRRVG
ncbi:MAG: peptide chain release factor N(5)-glutamine methyltransferase [Firmicutes bacterium]|nr:peptide chain release factor N(5)-glutamine methyltransferase [[Eubacterium] siraeum]MCM1487274.1 peptide chain release factor N(5)-glutamine methyltransferase [Bacillota bacterium]